MRGSLFRATLSAAIARITGRKFWILQNDLSPSPSFAYRLVHGVLVGTDALRGIYAQRCSIPISAVLTLPLWIPLAPFRCAVAAVSRDAARKALGIAVEGRVVLSPLSLDSSFLSVLRKRCEGRDVVFVEGETPEHFAAADIGVVLPSHDGFPLFLLCAMAAGLPTVAARGIGMEEIVFPAGRRLLVSADAPREWADRLEEVLGWDAAKRAVAARAMAEWVVQFDVVQVAHRLQRLLDDTLDPIAGEDQYISS